MFAARAVLPLYSNKFKKAPQLFLDTVLVSPDISDVSLSTQLGTSNRHPVRASPKYGTQKRRHAVLGARQPKVSGSKDHDTRLLMVKSSVVGLDVDTS